MSGEKKLTTDESRDIVDGILKMTDAILPHLDSAARLELFTSIGSDYCTHCGCDDPRCQCWNDE